MEFKITPFEDALESGEFERLCMECYGESILSVITRNVPDTSAFMGELFRDGRRVYFFTFCKDDKGMTCLTSSGHFNKEESPLPYLKRVLTYLHETGARIIFIEILSTRDDLISGALESGFEPVSSYKLNDYITMLQLTHKPGGTWENIKERTPLKDPVERGEKPGRGLIHLH